MQCPSCKEQIDDDSFYCDQCGIQIMVCSECGRPGAKKFCNFDGKPMVPAGSQAAPSAQAQTPAPTAAQVQTPVQPTPVQTGAQVQQTPVQSGDTQKPGQMPVGNAVKFSGSGITFEAKDGDVIGRKTGPFINIFASQSYVSGTHCKIVRLPNGWHIQDLGSTNGTFVQGTKLAPNAPYLLTNNAIVKIATTDFTVTF
jgi:predicted RNA-binding Zn-ribbon protein involved in translation (DUF1610 family)